MVAEYQRMQSERSGIQITSALIFMIVALLLLFASVWIGLALANQLVAPIGRLITAADRVRGGDLLARVPEDGPDSDEFVMLSRAFNRMTTPARQPAPRADRRQPASSTSAVASPRRCWRASAPGSSAPTPSGAWCCPTGRRRIFSTRMGMGWSARRSTRSCAAPASSSMRPTCIRTKLVERHLTVYRSRRQRTLLVRVSPQRDDGRTAGLHRHLRRHHRPALGAAAGGLGRGREADRARGQEPADARSGSRPSGSSANTRPDRRGPRRLRQIDRDHHPAGRYHRPPDQRVLGLRPDAGTAAARGERRRAGARRGVPAAAGVAADQLLGGTAAASRSGWLATAPRCRRR